MSREDREQCTASLIALARQLATERGHTIFGELANDDVAEFGLEDETGAHRVEVQASLGGMMTVLTSNGYELIDINNDWDVDGTVSPQVRVALEMFDAFTAGDFQLTDGWRRPNKYMRFSSPDLPEGQATRRGIGNHRGGPFNRRRDGHQP